MNDFSWLWVMGLSLVIGYPGLVDNGWNVRPIKEVGSGLGGLYWKSALADELFAIGRGSVGGGLLGVSKSPNVNTSEYGK